MIEITEKPFSPETLVSAVKTVGSGCVVTYVGLIRDTSKGRKVASMTYRDPNGTAKNKLQTIADEAKRRWAVENIAITLRTGKLKVGDINLVVAVAAAHRQEGFSACQYIIDEFKQRLPTEKSESYQPK